MDKEHITLEKLEGIYDIQPPPVPELSFLESGLILLTIVILIISSLYMVWHLFFSDKGRIKRKIKQLEKDYLDNHISSHETIYQLCSYLRQGLKINNFGNKTQLPEKLIANKKQWQTFTKSISDLRYKNIHKSNLELNKAFKESLFWLRVWP